MNMRGFLGIVIFLGISASLPAGAEEVKITSITLDGLRRTRPFVVFREIVLAEGETYSREDFVQHLERSVQNLKNLGIFSRVSADVFEQEAAGGEQDAARPAAVVFSVTDRWTFFPFPLYYADNKLGHIIGFNIQDFNLFGAGQSLHLKGMYNPDLKSIQLIWHYPRIGRSRFGIDFDIGYQYLTAFQYDGTLLEYKARTHTFFQDLRITKGFPTRRSEFRIFADSYFTYREYTEEIDLVGKVLPSGSTWTAGLGAGYGVLNRDIGSVWGDDNELLFNIHVPGPSFSIFLKHAKYFRMPKGGVLAYRIQSQINPSEEIQLNSLDVRGIKPGQLRGNYGFFGNIDYRPFLFSFFLLMDIDVYGAMFLDAGNLIREGEPFRIENTVITVGGGLRFYLHQFGGPGKGARFDFGVNINALAEGKSFGSFFFIALAFNEMF